MTQPIDFKSPKCLTGASIAAGILASSAAHAQLVVQNPNYSLSTDTTEYFNVSDNPIIFSTTDSGQNAEFVGPSVELSLYTHGYKDKGSSVTDPADNALQFTSSALTLGETIDSSNTGGNGVGNFDFSSGTDSYGFSFSQGGSYLNTADGVNYGYFTVTQTGSVDPTTGANNLVDTIDTVAYQTTVNTAVTYVATPEPSTVGLLAAAATGLAGLALHRRMRSGSIA